MIEFETLTVQYNATHPMNTMPVIIIRLHVYRVAQKECNNFDS